MPVIVRPFRTAHTHSVLTARQLYHPYKPSLARLKLRCAWIASRRPREHTESGTVLQQREGSLLKVKAQIELVALCESP
jgi:hypothetical protein